MWWEGGQPPSLVDVWRQERVQQRTVKQIVDNVPLVPLLHDVVPPMVEQLVDFLAPLDFRVSEQVIDVPKIVCPPRAARTVLRAPQTAEQLVEVQTEPGYALAVIAVQAMGLSAAAAMAEQIVDNPVSQVRRGGGGGLLKVYEQDRVLQQRTWSRSLNFQFLWVRRGKGGGLQGFPGQDSTALPVGQIVDIPVPRRGGLQGSSHGQGSTASSSHSRDVADEAGLGVFRTFPRGKESAGSGPHSRSELNADFNPSTLSVHQMPPEQLVGCASASGS